MLIDFPYTEEYYVYSSINSALVAAYVTTNASPPVSTPITINTINHPLKPTMDIYGYFYGENCDVCPTAWNLTGIVYPLGGEVQFEYEQGEYESATDNQIWSRNESELPIIADYNEMARKRSLRQDMYNDFALQICPNPFNLTDPNTGSPIVKTLTASFRSELPSNYGIRLKSKTSNDMVNPSVTVNFEYGDGHFTNIPAAYVQNMFSGFNKFMSRENFRHKWERLYQDAQLTNNTTLGWVNDFISRMGINVRTDISLHEYVSSHFYENKSVLYADGSKIKTHFFEPGEFLLDYKHNSMFRRTKISSSLAGAAYIFGGGTGLAKDVLPTKTEYFDANSLTVPYKWQTYLYDQFPILNISDLIYFFNNNPAVEEDLWSNTFEMWLPINGNSIPTLHPTDYYYQHSGLTILFNLFPAPLPSTPENWVNSLGTQNGAAFSEVKNHGVVHSASVPWLDESNMYKKKVINVLTSKEYYKGITTTKDYSYDGNFRVNKIITSTSSDADQIIETFDYATNSYNGLTPKFVDLNLISYPTIKNTYLNSVSNSSLLSASATTYDYSYTIPKLEATYIYETNIAIPEQGVFSISAPFSFTGTNSSSWRKMESNSSEYNSTGLSTLDRTNRVVTKNVFGNNGGKIKSSISYIDNNFDATYTGFEDIHLKKHKSDFSVNDRLDEIWYNKQATQVLTQLDANISTALYNICGNGTGWADEHGLPYYHLVTVDPTDEIGVGDAVSLTFQVDPSLPVHTYQSTIASIEEVSSYPSNLITGQSGNPSRSHLVCMTSPIDFDFIQVTNFPGFPNLITEDPGTFVNKDYTLSFNATGIVHGMSKTYARTGKYSYKLPNRPSDLTLPSKLSPIRPVKIFQSSIPTVCSGPLDPQDPEPMPEFGSSNNGSVDECYFTYESSMWLKYDFNIPQLGADHGNVVKSSDQTADQIYRRGVVTETNNNSGVRIVCDVWNSDRSYLLLQYTFYPENLSDLWQQYTVEIPLLKGNEKLIDVYVANDKVTPTGGLVTTRKSLFVDDILVYPKGAKYSYLVFDKFGNPTYSADNNDVFVQSVYDKKGRNIVSKNVYGKTVAEKFYFDQANYAYQNNHVTERVWTDNGQFNDTRYFLDGFGKTKQVMQSDLGRNIRVVSGTNVLDNKGNVVQSYKPYFLVGSNLSNKHDITFSAKVSALYGSNFAYKSVGYESKPEEMISSASPPRSNTESPIITTQSNYLNTVALTNPNLPTQSFGAGTLMVHEMIDDLGSKKRTYIDGRGRVIMEERFIGSTNHTQNADGSITLIPNSTESAQTWFVFDKIGRLIKTYDPDGMISHYTYNSANFLTKSDTPDKGIVRMRYNKYGQLRLTKNQVDADAETNSNHSYKQMEYLKYDGWERPIEDGVMTVAPNSLSGPLVADDYFNDYSYINNNEFPNPGTQFVQIHHTYTYDGSRDQFNSSSLLTESTFSGHVLGATNLYTFNHHDDVNYEYMADGQIARKEFIVDGLTNPHSFVYSYNPLRMPIGKSYINGDYPSQEFEWRVHLDNLGRPEKNETVYNSISNLNSRQYYDPLGNLLLTGVGPLSASTDQHLDYHINKWDIRDQLVGQMSTHLSYGLKYDVTGNMTDQYWKNTEYDPVSATSSHINRYEYTYDETKRLIGADYSEQSLTNNPFPTIDGIIGNLPSDFNCGPQAEIAFETVQPFFDQLVIDEVDSDQPLVARQATIVLNLLMAEYVNMAIPYATLSEEEKTDFFNVYFERAIASEQDFYALEKYRAYQEEDQEHLDLLFETEEADETLLIYTKDLMGLFPHEYPVVCYPNVNSIVHNFSPSFPFPSSTTTSNKYDAAYWYSKNGNMNKLHRNDNTPSSIPFGNKFIQDYTYSSGKNWLTSVDWTDGNGVSAIQKDYNYDANGNLIYDERNNENQIAYNLLSNLPLSMIDVAGSNNLKTYRYSAQDQRLVKTITNNGVVLEIEYYLDDVVLDQSGNVKSYQTSIGFAQPIDPTTIEYFYNVKDWLGTNRLVLDETGTAVNTTDHYPYGKRLPGRFNSSSNEGSRYQFTGHEFDDETTYEYHGARYYNRALGRYMSIDPLSVQFPSHSTYNYVMGNPIMLIDPDGMAPQGDYYTYGGAWIGSDGEKDNKVYAAESDGNGGYKNATELSITHSEFQTAAHIVAHESGGSQFETRAIAHTANNAKDVRDVSGIHENLYQQLMAPGYSTTPASAKTPYETTDNSGSAVSGRAAIIDVLTGGFDVSFGAVLWDGSDFLARGSNHNKFKEYKTISINSFDYKNYKNANLRNYPKGKIYYDKVPFNLPNETFSGNENENKTYQGTGKYYHLKATHSWGKTIFWSITPAQ